MREAVLAKEEEDDDEEQTNMSFTQPVSSKVVGSVLFLEHVCVLCPRGAPTGTPGSRTITELAQRRVGAG